MQLDVEGYEPAAMRGAAKLLTNRRIANIVMEYSPHGEEVSVGGQRHPRHCFSGMNPPACSAGAVSEKFDNETDGLAAVQMLMDLIDNDYSVVHVSDTPKSPDDSRRMG